MMKLKWHERRVCNTLKNEYDIEISRNEKAHLVLSQRDFYRLMDIMQLFTCTNEDYMIPEEISDYRANIADTHVDRMLDNFLTITGGFDDEFEKPFDLDRFNGTLLITRGQEALMDEIYTQLIAFEGKSECLTLNNS